MAPSYYKFSIEKGDFLPDFVNFRVDQFIQENICKFYDGFLVWSNVIPSPTGNNPVFRGNTREGDN